MKKKKQHQSSWHPIQIGIFIISIVALIFFITFGTYFFMNTNYWIQDRTDSIKKVEETYQDDVLSWIRVQGTNIDMPIIYRDVNTNLQRQDYDFAWSYSRAVQLTNRVIVTSHNVLNVSSNPLKKSEHFRRFEALPAFLYLDFAKKNQFIEYSINNHNYIYQIFSVSIVPDNTIDYDQDHYDKKHLKSYIDKSISESYYHYDIDVNEDDDIITLITCTRFFGATDYYSLKIEGRKLRENELAQRKEIEAQSSYHTIEDIMQEARLNEKV